VTTAPTDLPSADPESPVDHDVAVVGGGAAGLAAAVFTARFGLATTVFDGGKAAITQCAHIENYLGFPGGISPERFLALGRTHATHEGATVVDERVIVAAAYDGDVLASLTETLPEPAPFAPTEAGRTAVDGLYVAGWMSDETVHQVGVNAGHGARVGLALARDDMSERYWLAVGERYVDWVVHEGRYGRRLGRARRGVVRLRDATGRRQRRAGASRRGVRGSQKRVPRATYRRRRAGETGSARPAAAPRTARRRGRPGVRTLAGGQ
jgi:hypothetical protein